MVIQYKAQGQIERILNMLDTISEGSQRFGLIEEGLKKITNTSDSLRAVLYLEAGIYYGMTGKADSAIYFFNQSLNFAEKNQHLLKSRAYNGIGNVNRQIGVADLALENFLKALETLESKEDKPSQVYKGAILGNLAGVYFSIGNLEKAEFYSKNALENAKLNNSDPDIAYSQVQLALVYAASGAYEKALKSHEEANRIIREKNISYLEGYNLINLAKLFETRGELDRALKLYEKILAEGYSDIDIYTGALENSSGIYLRKKQFNKAIAKAKELLQLAKTNGMLPVSKAANRLLFESYQQLGSFEEANAYLNDYLLVNDSLLTAESFKILSELEAKYENEKKGQEITELKLINERASYQRNLILGLVAFLVLIAVLLYILFRSKTKSNAVIRHSLQEKEMLLKEIHHRVKNNLQVVSSLLRMQSRFIDDEKALGAVNEGQGRVESMALIHQKLYQEDNLTGVRAKEYISDLTETLVNTYNIGDRITIKMAIDDLNIDVDTIIPIGLILNELISNSFKHAFLNEDEGLLKIVLRKEDDFLFLKIGDNGIGLNEEHEKETFGKVLIDSLAQKLKASVRTYNNNGLTTELQIAKYKLI